MHSVDPNRIEPTLAALRNFWYAHPSWRLGQVIANASRQTQGVADPFYMDDDELVQAMKDLTA